MALIDIYVDVEFRPETFTHCSKGQRMTSECMTMQTELSVHMCGIWRPGLARAKILSLLCYNIADCISAGMHMQTQDQISSSHCGGRATPASVRAGACGAHGKLENGQAFGHHLRLKYVDANDLVACFA